ncbi:MAG TPA: N-acetyltransferase [Pyrinomonadaceae bacterium]|jgi:putative acetyltransferase
MIIVRAETSKDIEAVRRVNQLAFGRAEEANLVDALRLAAHPYISLVAETGGRVAGHIFFSPVTIETEVRAPAIFGLAPMAVLPEHQNQGIGSRLVREGLNECRRISVGAVVVLGHPAYYPRFGFVPASSKGLRCEYPVPDEAFMVTELTPGELPSQGLVKYHPEFGNV